jgi:hypothetical protein
VLIFAINLEQNISPEICSVLVELGRVVQNNSGNIYCIQKVIKAACAKNIAASILY